MYFHHFYNFYRFQPADSIFGISTALLGALISGITLIVLWRTLYWVRRYTETTEKILENEIIPHVEVNISYAKESKETYFWFSNSFNMPAFTKLVLTVTKTREIAYNHTLRIPPNIPNLIHFRHTAGIGLYRGQNMENETEVVLDVEVGSAMKNSIGNNKYRKSYKFNAEKQEWDESTWGFPDLPFPTPRNN